MKINSLNIENFRNIEKEILTPCDNINIIYGDNAQGKTNLIEAMWLFTGDKSFRGASDSNMVMFNATTRTSLYLDFFAHQQEKTAQIILSPNKKILLNEVPLKSRTGLSGEFYSVLFSPVHLGLIKNGPDERRRFIDQTICQLKPKYGIILKDFQRVLSQRNSLLKDIYKSPALRQTLDIWDYHLARLSTTIMKTRYTYIEKLKPFAIETYKGICSNKEKLDILYLSKLMNDNQPIFDMEQVLQLIKSNLPEDIATGNTNIGAHRDDVDFCLDGQSARLFGSQGQQRSIVLALKLAECEMIFSTSGEQPVVLLDDVMSELDSSRRDYLLNKLDNRQIFITCCDKSDFNSINIGKTFHIQNGAISNSNQISK
ncbi:MAG: DNA replication/repair protein RecF [Oscillospiraceae bacterium]